jgi:hypothetical protein
MCSCTHRQNERAVDPLLHSVQCTLESRMQSNNYTMCNTCPFSIALRGNLALATVWSALRFFIS